MGKVSCGTPSVWHFTVQVMCHICGTSHFQWCTHLIPHSNLSKLTQCDLALLRIAHTRLAHAASAEHMRRVTSYKHQHATNTNCISWLDQKLSAAHLRFNIQDDSKRWTLSRGRPDLLPLHRQPICSNWWFQRRMLKRRWNARCTAVADSVLMNSRTQKILCCIVAILLSTDAAARLCATRAL